MQDKTIRERIARAHASKARGARSKAAATIQTTDSMPYVLIREASFPGSWGRGETVADAIRAYRANGGRPGPVYAAAVSRDGTVDEMGDLHAAVRGVLYRATLTRTGRALAHLSEYRPAR